MTAGIHLTAGRRRYLVPALVVLAGLAAFILYTRHGGHSPSPTPRAAPVIVATVATRTVPVELTTVGTVDAYSTVSVKSQVDGQIVSAHFKQGGRVHKGDLLFTLDARPFQAQLQQVQATLARDRAQLENARLQLARSEDLVKRDYISRDQYDTTRTTADAMAATVRADEAAAESARLQLEYTSIHSPIDGIAGALMIYPGNLVKANDTNAMVILDQTQPIYVDFAVPQQYIPQVRTRLAHGKLIVTARIAGVEKPEQGRVAFTSNAVDTGTGTLQLKARFDNAQGVLMPGQYVNTTLILDELENATVIPAQAIQTGQNGNYVFVVRADSTVEQRPVVVATTQGGDAAISEGLKPGEVVIVDGQLGLVPGAKVEAKPPASGGAT